MRGRSEGSGGETKDVATVTPGSPEPTSQSRHAHQVLTAWGWEFRSHEYKLWWGRGHISLTSAFDSPPAHARPFAGLSCSSSPPPPRRGRCAPRHQQQCRDCRLGSHGATWEQRKDRRTRGGTAEGWSDPGIDRVTSSDLVTSSFVAHSHTSPVLLDGPHLSRDAKGRRAVALTGSLFPAPPRLFRSAQRHVSRYENMSSRPCLQ